MSAFYGLPVVIHRRVCCVQDPPTSGRQVECADSSGDGNTPRTAAGIDHAGGTLREGGDFFFQSNIARNGRCEATTRFILDTKKKKIESHVSTAMRRGRKCRYKRRESWWGTLSTKGGPVCPRDQNCSTGEGAIFPATNLLLVDGDIFLWQALNQLIRRTVSIQSASLRFRSVFHEQGADRTSLVHWMWPQRNASMQISYGFH